MTSTPTGTPQDLQDHLDPDLDPDTALDRAAEARDLLRSRYRVTAATRFQNRLAERALAVPTQRPAPARPVVTP